ncbi:thiol reductant ABC exporter subunit CydC [Rhizobium sp. PAMB 3182]
MNALFKVFRRVWSGHFGSLLLGVLLSVTVTAASMALLGLSGWFITAAGVAGGAGAGLVFDVFRPSAGVRMLAFGRAAARYGERLTTHDATLRGLARLRVSVLAAMLRRPALVLSRLRGSERLNRLTIDIDALDGLALRLVIPFTAAAITFVAAYLLLAWLTTPLIAGWQIGGFLVGIAVATLMILRKARKPSRLGQMAMQALRMRVIDMMRAQPELAVAGRLDDWRLSVMDAQDRLQTAGDAVDRAEHRSAILITGFATIAAGGSLLLGALATLNGTLDAAHAALGFFAALALAEIAAPLARGIGELGRMTDAARRIEAEFTAAVPTSAADRTSPQTTSSPAAPVLSFETVSLVQGGRPLLKTLSFDIHAGEIVALTGPSGSGKTTLLNLARGLLVPDRGVVSLAGRPVLDLAEDDVSHLVGYLPQRAALVGGSIADNLRLARPDASDEEMMAALQIAALDAVIAEKGGLEFRLGEGGGGLSGGEKRRLALARMVIRRPRLLLLDEPTEGLDGATAETVLARLQAAFPEAAILVAAHRAAEKAWAHRLISLS